MAESTQHKLDRVRPPRVQITYDVEIGDAIQMKELPFVVGIMADLTGHPAAALPKIKDRKFTEVDRDNFNDIMASLGPRLALRVDNKLTNDGNAMNVELNFKNMDDFNPESVVNQIAPLKALYDARSRLRDLLTKLDGNDELDEMLRSVLENTEQREALSKDLKASKPDA